MRTSAQNLPTSLSLRANFSWTLIGNIVYAGCQWAMLVVLAKLGSPVMLGQFALGLAVTAPILMLTNLHLRALQATDAHHTYTFGHYFALRLVTAGVALLVVVVAVIIAGYQWETAAVVLLIGVAKVIESISDVIFGALQQCEAMDRIAISMIIKGGASLVALGGGILLTGSVVWGAAGLALAWSLVLALYDWRNAALLVQTGLRPIWDMHQLRALLWLAFPLGVVMMLVSLQVNVPRYVIERYLGERDLGIFAALAYIMVAGTTVLDALGQAASPQLAKRYAFGERASFRALLMSMVGIGVAMGVVGVLVALLAGPALLTLIYRPEYAARVDVFVWLMVATGIGYGVSVLGYAITAARYVRVQVPLNVLSIVVLGCAAWVSVPRYGIIGGAWALLLANAFQVPLKCAVLVHALRHQTIPPVTRERNG